MTSRFLSVIGGGFLSGLVPAVLICLVASAAVAEEWRAVSFDMPHGGRRVVVFSDGTARYFFGALDAVGRIRDNTFSFETLVRELEGRVSSERCPGEDMGLLQFHADGQREKQYYICDRDYVFEFFKLAFQNRERSESAQENARIDVLDRMWQEAEPALPR